MKKSRFLLLLSILVFFFSCQSSLKSLRSGKYAEAVSISVKKLKKDPGNQKEILILEEAYKKLFDKDMEFITGLKKSGNPDIWDPIYRVYAAIQKRQDMVKALPELKVQNPERVVQFPFIDVTAELREAEQKAAAYHYALGNSLLEKGGRQNARKAYQEFLLVKNYFTNFKDTDDMLLKAKDLGTSYVLFNMENRSGAILPGNFEEELFAMNMSEMESSWIRFHSKIRDGYTYDYVAKMNIKMIDVSPESVRETHVKKVADIEDGWVYQLDKNGNVAKDAQGNDIKIMNLIRVQCDFIEIFQNKSARISGYLEFIDKTSGETLKNTPITSDAFFEYPSATVVGDFRALEPALRKKIRPAAPFPGDADMLMQAAGTLKNSIRQVVRDHKSIFN